MKKLLLMIVALFLSTTFILTGCNKGLPENPEPDAPTISNGGLAVVKGDYLYYVNGLQSYTGLEKDKDNVWGKQILGSIYRVKLNNNKIEHDENGFVKNSEAVVPQIVGTENASFYIFGNYIYYATPNMQVDEYGNLLNARSNICRIKLDGTDNKVLYTTDQTLTSTKWTMLKLDNTDYVVMLDGSKLISINANAKKPETTVMAKNVTSAGLINTDKVIPTDSHYNSTTIFDGVNNYVYYTRSIKEEDKLGTLGGNVLARVKIGSTTEEKVATNGNTYEITEVKNNCLYYNRTAKNSSNAVLCKYILTSKAAFNDANETAISYATYTYSYILNADNAQESAKMVAVDSSNNIVLIEANQQTTILYTGSTSVVPAGLYGSTLFFFEGTNINYLDVTAVNPTMKTVEINGKTIKVNSSETKTDVVFDYDGRNVYFYAGYAPSGSTDVTNYYLNRTDLQASEQKSEFVGVFAEGHTPAKPEADGDQDPENDIPWIS